MPREALDVLAARGRPGARLESELLAGGVPERSSARSVTGPSRLASSRRASEEDTPGTGDAKAPRASGAAESSEVAGIAREARPLAPARRGTGATTPASAPGASLALVASASTAPSPGDFLRSRAYRGDAELAVAAPPTAYAQRVGAGRLEALKLGGGSDETEAAVLAGLRYLAKRQRRSGAFAAQSSHDKYGDFRIGKTGLALLAFLGSGYTQHTPGEFQPTIEAALSFLLREQDRLSGHFGDSEAYGHGIATYALAEAFAMTKDPRLERPLARAVQRILAAQVTTGPAELRGGFGYYYADPERRFDRWPRLSVTVWQIMALKSARLAGIEIPERAFTMVKDFVLRTYDQELAAFRYNHDPDWLASAYPTLPGSNAATLFALELLGVPERDPLRQRALQYVLERRPARTWRPASNRDFATRGLGNLYYLYYASLGLYCQGGEVWQAWNAEMTRLLVPNQARDGSWKPISYYAEYCGDTDDDRVYTTALCVLTLEVYYRYFTPLLTSVGPPGAPGGAAPR